MLQVASLHIVMHIWIFMCAVVCTGAFWDTDITIEDILITKQVQTACYGTHHEAYVPFDHSKIKTAWFTPKSSNDTDKITIYDSTTGFQKPGYTFDTNRLNIEEVTEDNVGTYTAKSKSGGQMDFLILAVKECHILKTLQYASQLVITVAKEPVVLTFYPRHAPSQPVVLWDQTVTSTGVTVIARGGRLSPSWEIRKDRVTQKDEGEYVVRGRDGKFISGTQLVVKAMYRSETVDDNRDVNVWFSHHLFGITLLFTPEHRPDHTEELVLRGQRWSDRVGVIETTWITLLSVQHSHSGTYKLLDQQGNLVKTLHLTVNNSNQATGGLAWRIFKNVLGSFLALLLVLCVWTKFCGGSGGGDSKSSEDSEQPPNEEEDFNQACTPSRPPTSDVPGPPSIHYGLNPQVHIPDEDGVRPPPNVTIPYPEDPRLVGGFTPPNVIGATSLYPQDPRPVGGLTPPNVIGATALYPQVPGLDGEVPPTYENVLCSGSLFGPEHSDTTSAPDFLNSQGPLGSNTTTTDDVYTSDKLNFL